MAATSATAPSLADYAKIIAPSLPVIGGLAGVRKQRSGADPAAVKLEAVTADPAHLARYNRLCGFSTGTHLPATYLHNAAFAAHVSMLGDPNFPFAGLGMVHVANTIRTLRPVPVSQAVDLTVTFGGVHPHPNGEVVKLVSEATVQDELVWDDVSYYLHRSSRTATEGAPRPGIWTDAPPVGPASWRLPADLGRQFSAVSGDRNPIHLSALTAKAFGFDRAIAHGMWTAARALAQLGGRVPARCEYAVTFGAPIKLPGRVRFGADVTGDGEVLLAVTSNGRDGAKPRTHMVGSVLNV